MALKSQTTTVHISNENADSTAYSSATFAKIGEVSNIGAPSGEAADIDTTHLESAAKEYLVGLPDEGNIEIAMNAISGDPGHDELIAAKDDQSRRWVKITWSNGDIWYIKGLVKKYTWSAGVDAKIEAASTFRLSGGWTRL
ncbi:MAG: phage tail tube protein [Pseudomonadota bacterium]